VGAHLASLGRISAGRAADWGRQLGGRAAAEQLHLCGLRAAIITPSAASPRAASGRRRGSRRDKPAEVGPADGRPSVSLGAFVWPPSGPHTMGGRQFAICTSQWPSLASAVAQNLGYFCMSTCARVNDELEWGGLFLWARPSGLRAARTQSAARSLRHRVRRTQSAQCAAERRRPSKAPKARPNVGRASSYIASRPVWVSLERAPGWLTCGRLAGDFPAGLGETGGAFSALGRQRVALSQQAGLKLMRRFGNSFLESKVLGGRLADRQTVCGATSHAPRLFPGCKSMKTLLDGAAQRRRFRRNWGPAELVRVPPASLEESQGARASLASVLRSLVRLKES